MKKVVIGGAVIIILLTLGLIFIEPTPKNDTLDDNAISTESGSAVMLQPLSADVSVSAEESDWQVIETPQEVVNGNKVKTSAVGRAILTQDADILTSLNSNSELVVELGQDNNTTILKLAAGQTWTKINRALEQDEVYEVHTPTLVAAVRGTSFGVLTEPASQIIVTEGTVWVSLIDPETGEIDESSTIAVPAGKIALYVNGKIEVRDITDKDKGDWYYEHNPETGDNTEDSVEAEVNLVDPIPNQSGTQNENPPVVPIENNSTNTIKPEEPVAQKVTVTSVSPKVLDQGQTGTRLTLRGDFLSVIEKVVIDKREVEFLVTSTGAMTIEGAELPTDTDSYDITLYYDGEKLFLAEAFSVINNTVSLKIDSVMAGVTDSPEDFIELKGSGFLAVKTVLVDGQTNEFVSINNGLMHVFDQTFSQIKKIELVSPEGAVTYTR